MPVRLALRQHLGRRQRTPEPLPIRYHPVARTNRRIELPNPIRFSAPAERNRLHILDVLRTELPDEGRVLEIASGTGQHVICFAEALSGLHWQPSDPDPEARASIAARIAEAGLANIADPLDLDLLADGPAFRVDGVITANLLHISPPAVLPALMSKSSDWLAAGGVLHVYGPFRVNDAFTSPSNEAFDASLRQRNPLWGLRDLETVIEAAGQCGFAGPVIRDMPANNFSLTFRRS